MRLMNKCADCPAVGICEDDEFPVVLDCNDMILIHEVTKRHILKDTQKEYLERETVLKLLESCFKEWNAECGISRAEYMRIRFNNIPSVHGLIEV